MEARTFTPIELTNYSGGGIAISCEGWKPNSERSVTRLKLTDGTLEQPVFIIKSEEKEPVNTSPAALEDAATLICKVCVNTGCTRNQNHMQEELPFQAAS